MDNQGRKKTFGHYPLFPSQMSQKKKTLVLPHSCQQRSRWEPKFPPSPGIRRYLNSSAGDRQCQRPMGSRGFHPFQVVLDMGNMDFHPYPEVRRYLSLYWGSFRGGLVEGQDLHQCPAHDVMGAKQRALTRHPSRHSQRSTSGAQ